VARLTGGRSRVALVTAGTLPTAADMGEACASAAMDDALPSGHTVVVGGDLRSLDAPSQ